MPYKLKLTLADGSKIISPVIAPNNPEHNYDDYSICNEIVKTGASMVRRIENVKKAEMIVEH